MRVSGLILAGGAGARMGAAKAFVPFLGEPLLARAVRTLRPAVDDLVVACGRIARAEPWLALVGDARLVPDMGDGPMAGLRAGAAVATGDWLVVAPVDAPLVTAQLARELVAAAQGWEGAVPVLDEREQPLLACYHRETLARAAARVHLPRELPRAMRVTRVPAASLGGYLLRDADTPEELAELERKAQAARGSS